MTDAKTALGIFKWVLFLQVALLTDVRFVISLTAGAVVSSPKRTTRDFREDEKKNDRK